MSRNKIRVAASILVASIATGLAYAELVRTHGRHSDFGVVWFGARALLHRTNPYPLVGPGLTFDWFGLNYPATAMAAVLPLGLLPELVATLIFVWISTALLTYVLTRSGWQRIWILPSAAFIIAARTAQWSPLYSAALLMPGLGWMLAAKPTLGLAVAAAVPSRRLLINALVGTIVLVVVSLALLPQWPYEWLHSVKPGEFTPVIMWPGGFVALLALLRWRMPEARLLIAMACVPVTPAWYETLPLLLIGKTKRECQLLSLVSSLGYIVQGAFLTNEGFVELPYTRPLIVAFCYLPPLIVVLRRRDFMPAPQGANSF
ncbi:MAG TPA: hypothetical protein VM099_03385 [Gemmatimonadaceae bacterium]|nr:hypothetical protein [Gemmatimonadaceae bacterium]